MARHREPNSPRRTMSPSASVKTSALFLLCLTPSLASAGCNCYLTNDTSSAFYTSHFFSDFRHISNNLFSSSAPAVLNSASDTAAVQASSTYFGMNDWANNWVIQTWNNSESLTDNGADPTDGGPAVLMVNSGNNVFISQANPSTSTASTHLTLRTTRLSNFQSAAEMDTLATNYSHLSLRIMARITGPPGACAGIFTYRPPTSTAVVQEADLEILTSERGRVQLTNQPVPQNVPIHGGSGGGNASTESATQNVTLPANGNWDQWNVYRVDWIEGRSVWYLNGVVLGEINVQAPRDPAGVIVNLWSDGGLWSGGMGKGSSATMDVQWIEMAFNTSGTTPSSSRKGKRDVSGCKTVCGIDDAKVTAVGTPVVLWGAASAVSTFTSSTLLLLVLGSLLFVEAFW